MITSQTILKKNAAIIIDSDENRANNVKRILKGAGIKNIAIIDICCLNSQFAQIKELLMVNHTYLKIFHSGSEENFNNMIKVFNLENRKDLAYVNTKLNTRDIVIHYWRHFSQGTCSTRSSC